MTSSPRSNTDIKCKKQIDSSSIIVTLDRASEEKSEMSPLLEFEKNGFTISS